MRKYFGILFFVGFLILINNGQSQKIIFTPQWTAQAQFAGYYVAQEKGFFKEAGVEVEIVHPSLTQSAINRLRDNKCQATTLQLCQAMEIIDKGIPIVNVLQTSMNNAMVIVSHKDYPLKQKGIRVGVWNAGFGQIAICMSSKEGLDYEWIRFASNISLLLSGAIDATLCMSYNEYYQIKQAGFPLTEKNTYRFCDHGYNIQEDGIYVTREYYDNNRDQVIRFAKACKKGWEWAAEHPDETIEIVMKYVRSNHIATNKVLQKLMLKEILRLQIDRESHKREFRLRPDMVEQANRLMIENGMLKHKVTYEQLLAK